MHVCSAGKVTDTSSTNRESEKNKYRYRPLHRSFLLTKTVFRIPGVNGRYLKGEKEKHVVRRIVKERRMCNVEADAKNDNSLLQLSLHISYLRFEILLLRCLGFLRKPARSYYAGLEKHVRQELCRSEGREQPSACRCTQPDHRKGLADAYSLQ